MTSANVVKMRPYSNDQSVANPPARRNRRDKVFLRDVKLDLRGNIDIKRPVGNLDCLGDPVTQLRGEWDEPFRFTRADGIVEEKPNGCFGCRSRIACSTIVMHRLETDAELSAKHQHWYSTTQRMPAQVRYSHASFDDLADACEKRAWTSNNNEKLTAQRKANAKARRGDLAITRRAKKRGFGVTSDMLDTIYAERDERQRALAAAAAAPGAPTWLRNLTVRSIELTCDVWQTWVVLSERYGGVVNGGDITRVMIATRRDHGLSERSLRSRVDDARRRVDRLEIEPSGAPVWAPSRL